MPKLFEVAPSNASAGGQIERRVARWHGRDVYGQVNMVVQFLDFQDPTNPLNGARIDNRKELLEVLDGLRSREPFLCELVGENGYRLIIGIGDEIGCVQYSNDDVPYLLAVAPGKHREEEYVEFLSGNTPTPIPKRNILPFDVVKEIAGYFIETGKRSPAVSWEEV